ncbi:MAG: hypothetical protein AVDCRST_MAG43-1555, partial [uncultured Thermomicrobiales bacterium]
NTSACRSTIPTRCGKHSRNTDSRPTTPLRSRTVRGSSPRIRSATVSRSPRSLVITWS